MLYSETDTKIGNLKLCVGYVAQPRTRFKRLLHMACYMRLYKFFFHSTILKGRLKSFQTAFAKPKPAASQYCTLGSAE